MPDAGMDLSSISDKVLHTLGPNFGAGWKPEIADHRKDMRDHRPGFGGELESEEHCDQKQRFRSMLVLSG